MQICKFDRLILKVIGKASAHIFCATFISRLTWNIFVSKLIQEHIHFVKSVQIRSFFPNAGKYGPEKTSYLDTFHAVIRLSVLRNILRIYVKVGFILCQCPWLQPILNTRDWKTNWCRLWKNWKLSLEFKFKLLV